MFAALVNSFGLIPMKPENVHELQRLQYRRVDRLEHPGAYRVQGTRIDVALRPARFADDDRLPIRDPPLERLGLPLRLAQQRSQLLHDLSEFALGGLTLVRGWA